MKRSKLFVSGIIYTLGNILVQGVTFITLPIYTRIITPEVFGQYTLYTSWISIFSVFIGLQTAGSLSSGRVKYKDEFDEFALTGLSLSTLFFIILVIITLFLKKYLSNILGISELVLIVLVFQSFTTYIVQFFGQYFIQQQKSLLNLAISIFTVILNVVISLSLIYTLNNAYVARIIGGFLPQLLVSIFVIIYFFNTRKRIFSKKYVIFILRVSIPLIFHLLGHQALSQLSRIMIGNMLSKTDLAIFSFASSVSLILQIVLFSINTTWVPFYFESKKKQDEYLPSLFVVINISIFLTLMFLTISPELAYILGGNKYLSSIDILYYTIFSTFLTFLYTVPVNVQFYYANTLMIPIGTLIAAIANLIFNLFLIRSFGIQGAAYSTVISYFLLLICHHFITKIRYKYDELRLIQYLKIIFIIVAYISVMIFLKKWLIIRYIVGLLVVLYYALVYKNSILNLLVKIKKR